MMTNSDICKLLDITTQVVANLKEENKRLKEENARLLDLISKLSNDEQKHS